MHAILEKLVSSGPRIAIVGSGPAALGVITSLLSRTPAPNITLFDHGRPPRAPESPDEMPPAAVEAYYDVLYKEIWSGQRRAFPPPKTHLATSLPKYRIDGKQRILRSESFGGLSNFWGGTCLPFTERELLTWPINRKEMHPHYERIADVVGISGRDDALSEYFGSDFLNRPPMHQTKLAIALEQTANAAEGNSDFKIAAGVNRCALETRLGRVNTCIACGECLAGCVRNAIFSSRAVVGEHVAAGRAQHVLAKVRRFDPKARTLETADGGTISVHGPFDRIYLAAGCPGTTEIVLRSLGLSRSASMADNAVYVFPILYTGKRVKIADDSYLSLTNSLIGLLPRSPAQQFAQVQVYANFDYMWRYNVPPALWSAVEPIVRWSRGRLLWGRLYMHGDLSQSYRLALRNDALDFEYERSADSRAADSLMALIRTSLNRQGFYVPPVPVIRQKSNTHYACTFPYGGREAPVAADAQIAPNVFICDSSVFPALPAVSLTFTIMANAHRIASESL